MFSHAIKTTKRNSTWINRSITSIMEMTLYFSKRHTQFKHLLYANYASPYYSRHSHYRIWKKYCTRKSLRKSALVNYTRGSNQNNLNFMPFHQCFHVVQLRRKFSLRLNEYLIQWTWWEIFQTKVKNFIMKKQKSFKTSALCVLKLKGV